MALGTIQTGTGLSTGMDIQGTVDKLMAINAKPRDALKSATETVTAQKTAITSLTALLYSMEVPSNSLAKATSYQQRTATSSNPSALAATVTGNAAIGYYEYTPLQMAQSQKQLSSGFASDTASLGVGTITIRFGDRVDRGASLSVLNGGKGFVRGSMRITDGNGDAATIDLSAAQTMDDVINAINTNGGANVTATTVNGHIHLVDNSGGSNNMIVADIGSGKTAASLGLAGINSPTGSADGQDILTLYKGITLGALNDGTGVEVNTSLADFKYTLKDGTAGEIDFAKPAAKASYGNPETTLQQLIDEVSTQSAGRLKLSIAADGTSLALVDTTTGDGQFTFQSEYGSRALHDLGLDADAVNGVVTSSGSTISGQRILGGLKTVSLGSLNGGAGLGTLGAITLTDRTGATDTIDLSTAQTLDDVVHKINASSAVQIRAQVNDAGNGIELIDETESSSGSMAVADADATNTATKLQIKTGTSATEIITVNSGDLHLKVVGENTLLSSLNGGGGVAKGSINITNSKGATASVNLSSASIKTIGDVIRAINSQALAVHADLNATGDGILLTDTGSGNGTLKVVEDGSTTAADLGLTHNTATKTGGKQTIDGSMTYKIDIYDKDSLQNVTAQINQLNADFTAKIITDGSAQPYHLTITSKNSGKAGAMVIDSSGIDFSFQTTSKAQDAVLLMGPASAATTAVLTTSSTNTFSNLVDGLSLTVKQATGQTVNVSIDQSTSTLSASLKALVDDYNKFVDELSKDTVYDTANNKPATLTGDATAFNFGSEMTMMLSGLFTGAGKFSSLGDIGITFATDNSGHLQYDDTTFQNAMSSDPQAVQEFFTTKDTGFSVKFNALIERLAGVDKSLSTERLKALQQKIDDNNKRIDEWNTRLESQRESLLMQFYYMDLAVGKAQTNLKTLDSIAWMAENLYGNSSSSGSSSSSG